MPTNGSVVQRPRKRTKRLFRRWTMKRGLLGDHAERCRDIVRIAIELQRDGMRPTVEAEGQFVSVYTLR